MGGFFSLAASLFAATGASMPLAYLFWTAAIPPLWRDLVRGGVPLSGWLQWMYAPINLVGAYRYGGAGWSLLAGMVLLVFSLENPPRAGAKSASAAQDGARSAPLSDWANVGLSLAGAVLLAGNFLYSWTAFAVWSVASGIVLRLAMRQQISSAAFMAAGYLASEGVALWRHLQAEGALLFAACVVCGWTLDLVFEQGGRVASSRG